jgi:hypothetical protein
MLSWKKESSSIKKEMKKSYEKIKKDNIDELKRKRLIPMATSSRSTYSSWLGKGHL